MTSVAVITPRRPRIFTTRFTLSWPCERPITAQVRFCVSAS